MTEATSRGVSVRPEQFVVPAPTLIEIRGKPEGGFMVAGPHRAEFGHRIGPHDGIYAGWEWDGHTLRARTDRYGMWPLFYAADADGIIVSDSLTAMLPRLRDRALDAGALDVFL
jgi:hypothetical protein